MEYECSEQHYSRQPKTGKKSKHPSANEFLSKMSSIHTMQYYSAINRNKPFDIYCSMHGSQKLYSEKETRHKGYIVYNSSYIKFLEKAEIKAVVDLGWEWEQMG